MPENAQNASLCTRLSSYTVICNGDTGCEFVIRERNISNIQSSNPIDSLSTKVHIVLAHMSIAIDYRLVISGRVPPLIVSIENQSRHCRWDASCFTDTDIFPRDVDNVENLQTIRALLNTIKLAVTQLFRDSAHMSPWSFNYMLLS